MQNFSIVKGKMKATDAIGLKKNFPFKEVNEQIIAIVVLNNWKKTGFNSREMKNFIYLKKGSNFKMNFKKMKNWGMWEQIVLMSLLKINIYFLNIVQKAVS